MNSEMLDKLILFLDNLNVSEIDMMEYYIEIKELLGFDFLNSEFENYIDNDTELLMSRKTLENYKNFESLASFSCKFAIEDYDKITATPLFYSPSERKCITYNDSGNYMDEITYILNSKECAVYRASHHDFLSDFHNDFISFEDSFSYRIILKSLGYLVCFPSKFNLDSNRYHYTAIDENGMQDFNVSINEDLKNFIYQEIDY